MKKIHIFIFSFLILFMIIGTIIATILGPISVRKQNEILKSTKWYYYISRMNDTSIFDGVITKNRYDKCKMIKYYDEFEKGNNPIIDFDFVTLPIDTPVYITDFVDKDSIFVHVVCYFDVPYSGNNYEEGFLLRRFLHKQKFNKNKVTKLLDSIK